MNSIVLEEFYRIEGKRRHNQQPRIHFQKHERCVIAHCDIHYSDKNNDKMGVKQLLEKGLIGKEKQGQNHYYNKVIKENTWRPFIQIPAIPNDG